MSSRALCVPPLFIHPASVLAFWGSGTDSWLCTEGIWVHSGEFVDDMTSRPGGVQRTKKVSGQIPLVYGSFSLLIRRGPENNCDFPNRKKQ